MTQALLTINAGSSSLKFSVFETGRGGDSSVTVRGEVEAIGTAPRLIIKDASGATKEEKIWPDPDQDFEPLVKFVIDWVETRLGRGALFAVGHRIVHGGPDHFLPEPVTPDLLDALERLVPLAPLHQPRNLAPVRAIREARPDLLQVACFDTGFHRTMPEVATRLALPAEYTNAGVRRYGFHGLSYEHISWVLKDVAPGLAGGRTIVAHLGAGASLCAMRRGQSVDTTMGFTALDGLVMATRCGDLDPGVILYLQRQFGLTVDAVEDVLYRRSGLLGVSNGLSSDMRVLLASNNALAAAAIELFVFRIARETGALASSLGGIDGLVFTGGIGENAPQIRSMVGRRLAWLGVEIDESANTIAADVISTTASRVVVRIIPADEEATIARHTLDVSRARADRPV